MLNPHFKKLVQGYKNRTLTREELAIYQQLLAEGKLDDILAEDMDLEMQKLLQTKSKIRPILLRYWRVAMVLILGIGSALLIYQSWYAPHTSQNLFGSELQDSIPLMRLADGQTIRFDSNLQDQNHQFAYDGDENLLVYRVLDGGDQHIQKNVQQFHRVETPKRKHYKIQLEDGTIAWLNASSSLRFPVVFDAQERFVEITGEVYFDVAKEKDRPFRVKSGQQIVEVLGTRFNINSYADEVGIITTLLEGKVNVMAGDESFLMQPNDQTILVENQKFEVRQVDALQIIAWTNGFFQYRNETLDYILSKVSNWYSVHFEIDQKIANERYSLRFKQNATLDELILILNDAGIPAKLERNTLKVGRFFE